MSETRTVRSLGVESAGEMYFWEYEEDPPPEGHVRVDTLYSGLSAGTELTFFKGTNPYLHSRWDEPYGVFRDDEPGAEYPVPFLGYMEVGRVTESRAVGIVEGEIVGMAYGHKTGHTADAAHELIVPLPRGLDPVLGVFVAQMGPICANGLLHAAADFYGAGVRGLGDGVAGRRVLVTGGGTVGLLTGLFARLSGAAEVAVLDPTPERLAAADGLGLVPLDEMEGDPAEWCKRRWHHGGADRGADLVFQCRGRPENLQTALRSLRPQGTVIDLAFYQDGAGAVRFGEEFHHNGLAIRCAQIGRVPRGLAHVWNRRRLALETLRLLQDAGQLIREHVITDLLPFERAGDFVAELAARERHAIQAVFVVAS